MITAIDTCVLIDILVDDPSFGTSSQKALQQARKAGRLIVTDLVVAEIYKLTQTDTEEFLRDLHIDLLPSNLQISLEAGKNFSTYLKNGRKRGRILTDFFIGAHAEHYADRLLTRDKGFQRNYFKKLNLWYPS